MPVEPTGSVQAPTVATVVATQFAESVHGSASQVRYLTTVVQVPPEHGVSSAMCATRGRPSTGLSAIDGSVGIPPPMVWVVNVVATESQPTLGSPSSAYTRSLEPLT